MFKRKTIAALMILLLSTGVAYSQSGNGSSIFQNDQNKIELYPNPAVDYLIVEISNSSISNAEFELHSIIGNKIIIQPEKIGVSRYRIPLKNLVSGYYFLVVKDDFSRFKKAYKFLKK